MTPEEIKTLSIKIAEQEHVINLHKDQPEESGADPLWSHTHSYNTGFLHGLRWSRYKLIERAEEISTQQRKQESS